MNLFKYSGLFVLLVLFSTATPHAFAAPLGSPGTGAAAASPFAPGPSATADGTESLFSRLRGSWEFYSPEGRVVLTFISETMLTINGQQFTYQLTPGAIRLVQNYQYVDFPYELKGDTLSTRSPEGYTIQYTRVGAETAMRNPLDEKLSQLLVANAWCSFSYHSNADYNTGYNQSHSTTRYGKYRFFADGTWVGGKRAEVYSNGLGGVHASQTDGKDGGRWKVKNGVLYIAAGMSDDFAALSIKVKYNSNGSPIIVSNGTEYCRCK